VLIGRRVELVCVQGSGTTLRDLGDDARSTSGLGHEVGEAVERAGTFGVGRWRFAVVGSLVGARLGVLRKSGLSSFDYGSKGRRG
jgi:hypothetical protein